MAGKLGFQSGWTDPANGRVSMGARWYDPAAGQFTSRDTAKVNPDPDSAAANPFAYTGDDPLTAIDPTGHATAMLVGAGGGATQHPIKARPAAAEAAAAEAGQGQCRAQGSGQASDSQGRRRRPQAGRDRRRRRPRDLRRARAVRLDTVLRARRRELPSVG